MSQANGKKKNKSPKPLIVSVSMDVDMIQKVDEYAEKNFMSRSSVIKTFVRESLVRSSAS